MRLIAFSLSIVCLLTSCALQQTTKTPVDTLFVNATIWTGTDSEPAALGVSDGVIQYLGEADGADALNKIDLGGAFLMPGFVDNHVHWMEGGAALAAVQLRGVKSKQEFIQRIGEYAQALPESRWVLQGNWDHQNWGGELPHRSWIDSTTGDIPVFVMRIDGHMGLANTAALKMAGIDAQSATPSGGEIVRDDSGEPTGILKDTAMEAVFAVIPSISKSEQLDNFRRAQSHALSLGLTGVHAMVGGPYGLTELEAFRHAKQSGVMQIRAHVYSGIDARMELAKLVEQEGAGDEILRWGGVKALVDGALGSSTAWFDEPYLHEPNNKGFPLLPITLLGEQMQQADEAGLRLAIHGIGDKAITALLDSFSNIAAAEVVSRRYRIEHFQHPNLEAIQRSAKLGITAAVQPYHAVDDGRWLESRIGSERAKTTYAFRTILENGGRMSFGSDWPVAPLSPLLGVQAAVTRQTIDGAHPDGWYPEEKLSVDEALTAYTSANAYATFDEDAAGTLEIGKRADFVVLGDDPREVAGDKIADIVVLSTWLDGKVAFSRD